MSGEHTPDLIERADDAINWCEAENDHVPIGLMRELRDALAAALSVLTETAAERDRLRAEVERLDRELAEDWPEWAKRIRGEKAELVAALDTIRSLIRSLPCSATASTIDETARAALAKATAAEGGE